VADSEGNLNPSFLASDIDIAIEAGQDDTYVGRLQQGLQRLAQNPMPDLVIVVSGVDPYEKDELT
jgi:acetoin utilization deacetylase AcuC-like enzyme